MFERHGATQLDDGLVGALALVQRQDGLAEVHP
jgi:hypothetical protein